MFCFVKLKNKQFWSLHKKQCTRNNKVLFRRTRSNISLLCIFRAEWRTFKAAVRILLVGIRSIIMLTGLGGILISTGHRGDFISLMPRFSLLRMGLSILRKRLDQGLCQIRWWRPNLCITPQMVLAGIDISSKYFIIYQILPLIVSPNSVNSGGLSC